MSPPSPLPPAFLAHVSQFALGLLPAHRCVWESSAYDHLYDVNLKKTRT
jgi:hypothetical protein